MSLECVWLTHLAMSAHHTLKCFVNKATQGLRLFVEKAQLYQSSHHYSIVQGTYHSNSMVDQNET